MPLKAIIDGEITIGPDLSSEEWADLRLRHARGLAITMDCCGAAGHLRKSRTGTQHFYHAVDTGCHYAEESKEHLEIKYLIYRICKSEGWETSVEYTAADRSWIADVYATKDGRNIVFEIQISPISPQVLEDRDTKYRNAGIESYWLLDNFLGRTKDFASWYDAHLSEGVDRHEGIVPYIDPSFFVTGPENHIFITKGIRSVGMNAKKQTLFTTNNPEISPGVWVREVLKGNYGKYLQESAEANHRKRQLKIQAAPGLFRFREFYHKIVRDETYRKKVGNCYRSLKNDERLRVDPSLKKKFDEISFEIGWLNKEYRSFVDESSGLFYWKKILRNDTPLPFFRLESEAKIRKLEECVGTFSRWEESFDKAMGKLERELGGGP